jgi:hypothetical protein
MENKKGWFDDPGNVKLFLKIFFSSLVVLLIVDFFIHKHSYFYWEDAPDFFAAYGFISCVLLVLVAKVLRLFIKRDEDYYDR